MGLLRRGPRLPAERRPTLAPDERILAWSPVDSGDVVVTNYGVHLPGTARLGWHEISKAAWDGNTLTVTGSQVVEERTGYLVVADRTPIGYALKEPGDVPHQIRARVTHSVAFATHHPAPGVWVAARRVPGVDGLIWMARYDAGVAGAEPSAAALTDQLVETARATT